MKQPLGIAAVLYVVGLLLGNFFQPPLPFLFAVSFATAATALLLRKSSSFLLWPLIVLTGWTNFVWHTAIVSPLDLRVLVKNEFMLAHVRGTLVTTPSERLYVNDQGESFRTVARINVTALRHAGALDSNTQWQPVFGQVAIISSGELTNGSVQNGT